MFNKLVGIQLLEIKLINNWKNYILLKEGLFMKIKVVKYFIGGNYY